VSINEIRLQAEQLDDALTRLELRVAQLLARQRERREGGEMVQDQADHQARAQAASAALDDAIADIRAAIGAV